MNPLKIEERPDMAIAHKAPVSGLHRAQAIARKGAAKASAFVVKNAVPVKRRAKESMCDANDAALVNAVVKASAIDLAK